MDYYKLKLCLWPGKSSPDTVRDLLSFCLENSPWFEPRLFGLLFPEERFKDSANWLNELMIFYNDNSAVCVGQGKESHYVNVHPIDPLRKADSDHQQFSGSVGWMTQKKGRRVDLLDPVILEQILSMMRVVNCPYGFCGDVDDHFAKSSYLKPDVIGKMKVQRQVPTISGFDEGLAGIFWRNFFGLPFIKMFGEKLQNLPDKYIRYTSDDIWVIQAYERPEQAGTDAARNAEKEIIEHLGEEHFYDHVNHEKPKHPPDLSKWEHTYPKPKKDRRLSKTDGDNKTQRREFTAKMTEALSRHTGQSVDELRGLVGVLSELTTDTYNVLNQTIEKVEKGEQLSEEDKALYNQVHDRLIEKIKG